MGMEGMGDMMAVVRAMGSIKFRKARKCMGVMMRKWEKDVEGGHVPSVPGQGM